MGAKGNIALVCFVFLVFNTISLSRADCYSRPVLKQYSGYPSKGQEYLRDSVKILQSLLNKKGNASLEVDGYFGVGTDAALKEFQSSQELFSDGVAGPQTWSALCDGAGDPSSLSNPHQELPKGISVAWNPIMDFVIFQLKRNFSTKLQCTTSIGDSISDHPGNAADCFPGDSSIPASGQDFIDGNEALEWLKKNAAPLKICYLIWRNYIWHRLYGTWYQAKIGITIGHYDHIHISVHSPDNSCWNFRVTFFFFTKSSHFSLTFFTRGSVR